MNRIGLVLGWFTAALVLGGYFGLVFLAPTAQAITDGDIDFSQEDTTLTIHINNLDDGDIPLTWQYAKVVADADCHEELPSLETIGSAYISNNNRTALILDFGASQPIYCFVITDNLGLIAVATYQPRAIEDNEGPIIKVDQADNKLTISADDADLNPEKWRYEVFTSNPDCETEEINRFLGAGPSRSNEIMLGEDNNDTWYCFQAEDILGNRSIAKHVVRNIDTSNPEIRITQVGRQLTATASENVTGWLYVYSPSAINCDEQTFLNNRSTQSGSQVTLTSGHINYYYCFKATDSNKNEGFGLHQIEDFDSSTAQITARQVGLKIIIENTDNIKSLYYLRSNETLPCDQSRDFDESGTELINSQEINLAESDDLRYFCIRGINSSNTASFVVLQVNTQIARIDITVENNMITAKSDEDNLVWYYLKTDEEPACDDSNRAIFEESNFDRYAGNTSELNELDNGTWFCFQGVNESGNASYKKQRIAGIAKQAPGAGDETDSGRTDVIIITASLIVLGASALTFFLVKKKRKGNGQLLKPLSSSTAIPDIKTAEEDKSEDEEEILQPLDYLKRDSDKKE